MDSCQIYLFGDLTTSFDEQLRQLLHDKGNESLQSFLDQVAFALRNECGKLPADQQDLFPRFTKIVDLVPKVGDTEGTPVLKFTLLSLCEIGQFIRYFGEGPRQYPSGADSYVLGLCTGSFAAAAVSCSRSVSELIPAGIEAVIAAFRTALHSLETRNEIEKPLPEVPRSWSTAVNASESEALQYIEAFCLKKHLPSPSKPYLSAVTSCNVTISGPPRILEEFLAESSLKPHHLCIESPFHAPHLFASSDVNDVIGELLDNTLQTHHIRIPAMSAASGKVIAADNFRALLHRAVCETLSDQVRWDNILKSCVEVLQESGFKECTIHSLSSNAAPMLASALSGNTDLGVKVDDLAYDETSTKFAQKTGKFEHSKIAIVGYSGRFPDAASNEEFWDLLRAGRDVHRTVPEDRFDWRAHVDPTGKTKNTSRVQYGCFIREPGLFDTRFFNMSPRESENTDPAQRLAITTAYEAIEMAGMVPNRTPATQQDRVGVFFGVTSDDWREVNSGQDVDTYFIPGGNRAFVPGRISYFFRFSGPSLSMDTACSSSFAAIQTACGYLWRGECDTVIAGGTNVLTNPDNFAGLDRGHFLSTTGNCNAFDDAASGYCRADAVGSVVLKRLEDAEADSDPIFGIIRGAFTNHCGQTDSITRPHEGDQASVFRRIIRHADVDTLDVSYIEMHGTGTQAGDATEMNSVLSVFVSGRDRMPNYPLYLGSAKANIGHAESASGVSSLIKVLLMMRNNEVPPHCGIKTKINHSYPLDLKERNVNIATKPVPWCSGATVSGKRLVFLNNFSAAGGNTAMLLEDAPASSLNVQNNDDPRTIHPVTVSAKSAKSLDGNIKALLAFLEANPQTSVPCLSYTTTARRMHHNYRVICSGSEIRSICDELRKKMGSPDVRPIPNPTKSPRVAFVFTGQGTIYAGIGKQLFQCVSKFRADILRFDGIARRQGFPSFLPLIHDCVSEVGNADIVSSHLAVTCIQIALSRLWISWGVHPNLTIGHSLGEYAALHTAGVLTVSDTIYLVGTRAQLLVDHCNQRTHSMLAVRTSLEKAKTLLGQSSCSIACINQPTANVIGGPAEEIDELSKKYQEEGNECKRLDVPYAFHSAQVDPILESLEQAANNVRFSVPSIPYVSPLLGRVVSDGATLEPSYLARACRHPVNFQEALTAAKSSRVADEQTIWLEIGPHPACSSMVKGTLGSRSNTIHSLRKGADSWKVLTESIETLYLSGIGLQWNEYHRDFKSSHKVLNLPRYSWDLKNYWIAYRNDFCLTKGDVPAPVEQKPPPVYISPSAQRVVEEQHAADISSLLVESDIHDAGLAPVLQGHRVNGVPLCPSTLYADIAMTMSNYLLQANNNHGDGTGLEICNMKVDKPLILVPESDSQLLRVFASGNWAANVVSFTFYSSDSAGNKLADHATCQTKVPEKQTWLQDWKRSSYLIRSRITSLYKGVDEGETHKVKRGMAYKLFSTIVDYHSTFRGMDEVVLDSDELEATAKVSFQVEEEGFYFNPRWIDSLGHLAGFIMNGNDNAQLQNQLFINHGWETMRCAVKFKKGKTYQSYNKMQLHNGTVYVGDTYILEENNIVAIFEGVKFQGVPRHVLDRVLPPKPTAVGASSAGRTASNMTARPEKVSKPTPSSVPVEHAPAAKETSKGGRKTAGNKIMPRVLAIISEEAGVEFAELQPNSEFADLGVDSLLSLTITGRLQEELGLTVQSTLFADYLTVKELSDFFEGENRLSSATSSTEDSQSSTIATSTEPDAFFTSVPKNERITETIRSVIAEETGVSLPDLSPLSSFSSLGIDSLLALTISGRLAEGLGMEVPQSLLADNDNLRELETALSLKAHSAGNSPTKVVATPEPGETNTSSPPHATSVLLQGSPKTATKTLFLFPDGSGSATSYAALAKISSDVVVYGLNCPWMKTPQDMTCTLEDLTSKYLVEIRRRQPNGPYYFGGWSAGGICAFEAAQQLSVAGEEPAGLILIDSPDPIGLENPPQRMYDFFDGLDVFGMNGKAPPSWLRPHFNAFLTMLDHYKIKPFTGRSLKTHLVYARDGICKYPDDPRPEMRADDPREMLWLLNNRTDFGGAGWNELLGQGNLNVHVIDDVNHFSLVAAGPKIAELSAFIRRAMA